MDILEEKQKGEFDNDLKNIIKILKFKKFPIHLKGSASLKSQQYYSDFDLFTEIRLNYNTEEIYDEFRKILNNIISSYDLYFIEFKLQTKKGEKYKWFPNDEFNYEDFKKAFKDIDFGKIDLIARIQNIFIEISCNYIFGNKNIHNDYKTLDKKQYAEEIKELKEGILQLKKENNYYKILKRLFSIYKLEGDYSKLEILNKIFNSELGKKYKLISNLEAIKLLSQFYDDADTKKKIEINLTDIKEPHNISSMEKHLKKYKSDLNTQAKKIYNNLLL